MLKSLPLDKDKNVDKVKKRQAAIDKFEDIPITEPKNEYFQELDENNLFLIRLTKELQKINDSCEAIAKDIFSDKNYIDPNFDLYHDKANIMAKIDRVFQEMLFQKKSKEAFNILKKSVEEYPREGASPESWDQALKAINACRENEIFYFFETLFESFRLENLSQEDIAETNRFLLLNIKRLMAQQHSMSNLLFVTNIIMKSAKSFSQDSYSVNETKRLFEKLVDFWRVNSHYYQENSRSGDKKRNLDIDFYRDYIQQADYFREELSKLVEDLLL